MPAVTHCRDTVSRVAVAAGHHHAADARREAGDRLERAAARLPVQHVRRRGEAARGRSRLLPDRDEPIRHRGYGSGRSSVASTSAKIALLAPMPSASVSVATSVNAGAVRNCRNANLMSSRNSSSHRVTLHLTISLSAKVHTRPLEAAHVAHLLDRQRARGRRIHAAGDELARAHLDVQRDLFVELLIERHAPQPRTQGTLHVANTFETPVENFFHVAISAASCSRPASVSRYNLARRPSSDVPHSASTHPLRSSR